MDFNSISSFPLFFSLFSALYSFHPILLFCLFVSFATSFLCSSLLFPLLFFLSLLFRSPFQAASALPWFPLQWCLSPAFPAALCQLLAPRRGYTGPGPAAATWASGHTAAGQREGWRSLCTPATVLLYEIYVSRKGGGGVRKQFPAALQLGWQLGKMGGGKIHDMLGGGEQ